MDAEELVTRPKPTWYNNYYFRSKLEAKWAVFFDLMKIKWNYEPEQFTCKDGSQYTPDFFLPDAILREGLEIIEPGDFDGVGATYKKRGPGVYFEIKPFSYITDHLYEERILSSMKMPLILFVGDPLEAVVNIHLWNGENKNIQLQPWWDNYMVFMYCKDCNTIKVDFDEGNYYYCPKCNAPIDWKNHAISHAAEVARNFRFQFYDPRNK